MAQPITSIITANIKVTPSSTESVLGKLKKFAKHGKLSIEVVEDVSTNKTRYVTVLFKNGDNATTTEFLEGCYYREGCYSFWVNLSNPTDELKIDDTTSLNPKNLTEDDITMLEMTNTYLSKELLRMYLMIKDLLDSRIDSKELIDNMHEYVYSLSK